MENCFGTATPCSSLTRVTSVMMAPTPPAARSVKYCMAAALGVPSKFGIAEPTEDMISRFFSVTEPI